MKINERKEGNGLIVTEDGWLTDPLTGMVFNKKPILNPLDKFILTHAVIRPKDLPGVLKKLKELEMKKKGIII